MNVRRQSFRAAGGPNKALERVRNLRRQIRVAASAPLPARLDLRIIKEERRDPCAAFGTTFQVGLPRRTRHASHWLDVIT